MSNVKWVYGLQLTVSGNGKYAYGIFNIFYMWFVVRLQLLQSEAAADAGTLTPARCARAL